MDTRAGSGPEALGQRAIYAKEHLESKYGTLLMPQQPRSFNPGGLCALSLKKDEDAGCQNMS